MTKEYAQFACPNAACSHYNAFDKGNIAHHSWIGKNKDIERIRCKVCFRAFSSLKGTLRQSAKIAERQQVLLLKSFRWGVPDEGVADIAGVDIKTVRLFRSKVAKRAQIHHDNEVQEVENAAAECDELYAKHKNGKTWVGVSIAVPTLLILAVALGSRNQALADILMANTWARCSRIGMILSDGWRPYWSALIRCFGRIYRPRRPEKRGRLKQKKIDLKKCPFYGQVVKKAKKKINRVFALIGVECRALIGSLVECSNYLRIYV